MSTYHEKHSQATRIYSYTLDVWNLWNNNRLNTIMFQYDIWWKNRCTTLHLAFMLWYLRVYFSVCKYSCKYTLLYLSYTKLCYVRMHARESFWRTILAFQPKASFSWRYNNLKYFEDFFVLGMMNSNVTRKNWKTEARKLSRTTQIHINQWRVLR